jgi:radical SAM superfamily enzyme YgiQ (UPF0313 family)
MKPEEQYDGFELGPIRPPSEAKSLLLRITRNCPWNRCKFCSLYKGEKFSIRLVSHILKDIDLIKEYVDRTKRSNMQSGSEVRLELTKFQDGLSENEWIAFDIARNWVRNGMKSIFLQDANSLAMKPDNLVAILKHLSKTFPQVERITTYARSRSIARISDDDMARIAGSGLNRIHIGMESGSDEVLDFIKKGVDKETHIIAGQKVRRAGIELSEYYMPGLGGRKLSRVNALETADAMNKINPDFIRIRTLAVPEEVELFEDVQEGRFTKIGDIETAKELLLFLEHLNGITSTVKSDHILNLLQEVEGQLPDDKEMITAPIKNFLSMDKQKQLIYIVGRRAGVFRYLDDINDPVRMRHAEKAVKSYCITFNNVDDFTAEMMKRFI